jgi:murein DD-endopeptidase MepM/ murein hydrolase activator NlpD
VKEALDPRNNAEQRMSRAAQDRDLGNMAQTAAEEGIARGIQGASGGAIPKPLADAAGIVTVSAVKKAVGVAVVMALTLLMVVFAGATFGDTDFDRQYDATPAASQPLDWLPLRTLRAYQMAAGRYDNGGPDSVPWTIVAAIGTLSSENGRVSPYDSCDRARDRAAPLFTSADFTDCDGGGTDFAEVAPKIVKDGSAVGPFLLADSGLVADGKVNPHDLSARGGRGDPETATDFVAFELDRVKTQMVASGWALPASGDHEAAKEFWVEVVSRLPLRSPGADRCAAPVIMTGGRSILGPAAIPLDAMKAQWDRSGKGQPSQVGIPMHELIELYYEEGEREGVRPDWAFAQAIQETGWFTVGRGPSYNNFAGIAHYDNADSGRPFASPQEGVRAHIQLLRKVVEGNEPAFASPDVSPDWGGKQIAAWDQMGGPGAWASDVGYWLKVSSVYGSLGGVVPAGGAGTSVNAPPPAGAPLDGTSRDSVGVGIINTWTCELANAADLIFLMDSDRNADGEYTNTLSGPAAVDTIVTEALGVAWAWSGWGERNADAAYCETVGPDQPAGVFPLTQETFDQHASDASRSRGRCDAAANIQAAVKAFIVGETTPPGEKVGANRRVGDRSSDPSPHNPMIGGWWAMPWALGSPENLERFLAKGNMAFFAPTEACTAQVDTWVSTLAADATMFAPLAAGSLPDDISIVDAAAEVSDPRASGTACDNHRSDGQFERFAASRARAKAAALTEADNASPSDSAVASPSQAEATPAQSFAGVARYLDARSARIAAVVPEPVPGVDSAVSRLSTTRAVVTGWVRPKQSDPTSYARHVVDLATALGGVTPNDPSAGRQLSREELTELAAGLRKKIFGVNQSGDGDLPGFPTQVMNAVNLAVSNVGSIAASCRIDVGLFAALAYTETASVWPSIPADGTASPAIVGLPLDGSGTANNTVEVPDTDGGLLDTDPVWDRQVGPYKFLPTGWTLYGLDGNADGAVDPQNFTDASYAALKNLCAVAGENANLLERAAAREAVARFGVERTRGELNDAAYAVADGVLNLADWYRLALSTQPGASSGGAPEVVTWPTSAQGIQWPTTGPVLSAFRTADRPDHQGIDISPPFGTPVYAVGDGTVSVFVASCADFGTYSCGGGYGNHVYIDHGDGFQTRYAHMTRTDPSVRLNAPVVRGQLIGFVGSSGHSTGPHLHFETRQGGTAYNPLSILPPR